MQWKKKFYFWLKRYYSCKGSEMGMLKYWNGFMLFNWEIEKAVAELKKIKLLWKKNRIQGIYLEKSWFQLQTIGRWK